MDLAAILAHETGWLDELLRGAVISNMAFHVFQRTTAALTDEDIGVLKRCWAVCVLLERGGFGWPAWPEDLRPVAMEVFLLAAFALTQPARPAMQLAEQQWPGLTEAVQALLARRFQRATIPDAVPETNVRALGVPQSCAELLREAIHESVISTMNMRFAMASMHTATPAGHDMVRFRHTVVYNICASDCEISFAGAMLLITYLADLIRRVQSDAATFSTLLAYVGPEDIPIVVRHHTRDALNEIMHLRSIPHATILHAARALSDEFHGTRADRADMQLALAMGTHERLGEACALSGLDRDMLSHIRGQLTRYGYGVRVRLST